MSSEPSTPDSDHPLIIELRTDLGCPWCYIGKHPLERAIAAAAPVGQVQLTLRSFELDPDMSATAVPIPEAFVAKHGGTTEQARRMEAQMAEPAQVEGLPYSVDRPAANTFDVPRVLHLARAQGVATPLFSTLQRGYVAGEHNPFDKDEPVRVAAEWPDSGAGKRVATAVSGSVKTRAKGAHIKIAGRKERSLRPRNDHVTPTIYGPATLTSSHQFFPPPERKTGQ